MAIFDYFRRTPVEPAPAEEEVSLETKDMAWTSTNPGGALLWGNLFPGSTGTPLTWLSSMQSAAVYACLKVLSEDVAKMPVRVKTLLPNGGAVITRTHRVAKLLRNPNKWQNPFEFWAFLVVSHQLRGNAFILVKRNGRGEANALVPISPDRVTLSYDTEGNLVYTISHPLFAQGTTMKVTSEDMIHVKNLTLGDGLMGMSPITFASDSIGLALAAQRHAALLFGQGTLLNGVLEAPGKMSKEAGERLSASWNNAYQGGTNAHKVAVLEEGIKFNTISMTAQDAQLLDSRKFSSEEIARIFRVPPHKIGILDRSTNNNIESQSQSYLDDSLLPIARRFEEALENLLFFSGEREKYEIKFDFTELLRADVATRFSAYQVGLQNGFLTANEVRIEEGLEPVDDPEASKLHFPLNAMDPKNNNAKDPEANRKPKAAPRKRAAKKVEAESPVEPTED